MPVEPIPVIDLFAGPGGLAEGFSAARLRTGRHGFEVRLSIEKDPVAHRTLELRSFFRSFRGEVPDEYYDYLRGAIDRETLFGNPRFRENVAKAKSEAWCFELGPKTRSTVSMRVKSVLKGADKWVLVGGPPCQAYSLIGRARMRPVARARFERDERHYLYREYLRILADHRPPVFIMENVPGLLSSRIQGRLIFDQILADLARPNGDSLRYRIVSLVSQDDRSASKPEQFVVRSELYGIPQTRHRVIVCGIREDVRGELPTLVPRTQTVLEDAIGDLPAIRSALSKEGDSHNAWIKVLNDAIKQLDRRAGVRFAEIIDELRAALRAARSIESTGRPFIESSQVATGNRTPSRRILASTLWDDRLGGYVGHQARSHMRQDLHRYFFAAAYAQVENRTPKLGDFPSFLLPRHRNVRKGSPKQVFADRFRVQVAGRPATTVTAHIAKDGHYFIHPSVPQCRSLTVREAARIQTFPDNYFFEGNRTQQYTQIGNAVPPLLAQQIAAAVLELLEPSKQALDFEDAWRTGT